MARNYKIGLVHATMNSVVPILEAFQQFAPDVKLLNFMDEGLIDELNNTGNVTDLMVEQLVSLMKRAEESGVDGILLTCSSFSPYVAGVANQFDIPVLSADIAMLEHAIEIGDKLGVIATVGAAGPTTTKLLYEIADEKNRTIKVDTHVITEAFTALQKGDQTTHNRLIREKISELSTQNDVILLAQMSMCRSLVEWEKPNIPILTSPEISIRTILKKVQ